MSKEENSERKSAKKRRRWWVILLWFPMGLLLTISVLWFALTSTQYGKKFVNDLGNSALQRFVAENSFVEAIDLQFPPRLLLHNLVIYDHKDSVLFQAEALRLTPVWPPVQDSILLIDQVVMSHFTGNMKHYVGDENYNYHYALKLNSSNKAEGGSEIKDIRIRKLIFEEGAFNFSDYTQKPFRKPGEYGIDFYRLKTGNINGVLDSITMTGGVRAHLNGFSVRESSGFVIRQLDADMTITNQEFLWDNMLLKTNQGELRGDVDFEFGNWKIWKEFNDSVRMDVNISEGEVHMSDLAYFSENVLKLGKAYQIRGKAHGKLRDFELEDMTVSLGGGSFVDADAHITGLPRIEETFIDAVVSDSRLLLDDINHELDKVTLPAELSRLGDVRAAGKFVGYADSFHVAGQVATALGFANSDIDVYIAEDTRENHYRGKLNLTEFNLGEFVDEPTVGTVNFVSEVDIFGSNKSNLHGDVVSEVKHFEFNGYDYKDVVINGTLANYYFDGVLRSTDRHADLEVLGKVDFSGSIPQIDLRTQVNQLDLHELHLSDDSISVQTIADMKFSGSTIENFVGNVHTENLWVTVNGREYKTGETTFNGSLIEGGKLWVLQSDIATARLKTSLYLVDVIESLQNHGLTLLPKNMGFVVSETQDYLAAKVDIHEVGMINSLLPDMRLERGTKLKLLINDDGDTLMLKAAAPSFEVAGVNFQNPRIKLNSVGDELTGTVELNELLVDSLSITNYAMDIQRDSAKLYLDHSGWLNDTLLGFRITQSVAYTDSVFTTMSIDSSELFFARDTFSMTCDSISWDVANQFSFNGFNIALNEQLFRAEGFFDLMGNYDFDYSLHHIDIANATPFFPEYFAQASGELNGDGHVGARKGHPVMEASVIVNPIEFRNLDIGSVYIESHYKTSTSSLGIFVTINTANSFEILNINGGINYGYDDPTMDVFFKMDKVPSALFEVLATDIVSNLEGTVSSDVRLNGSFNEPRMSGWVSLNEAKAHIDYLGTTYAMQDTFALNSKGIHFDNLMLTDARGEKAFVNGKIVHENMSRFDLDLDMTADNFTLLNTTEKDNDLYYGQLYATGTARFEGPMLKAKVSCDLETEENTRFYLPIQEDQGYSQESFIRFIDVEGEKSEYEVADNDFSLDLYINMNTKAETQLIFDKQLGDIIKATGDGRINLSLSPSGEFQMFGDYIIDNGNYLFTAFDLINKRFEIERGSKVSWIGSPYDALIDIRANYYLKASAYNLAQSIPQYDETRLEQYRTPVSVIAFADLKGSLLSPEISLDFEFVDESGVDVASLQRELENMQLSEEELTKQVVSLLVLNRFMPMYSTGAPGTDIFGSSVNAGLGDLISNQLTYWLSSISDDIQVNLNYRNAAYESDGIVLTQNELELALSTTFFNDRVSLNYTYEFQNGYSPNKEIAYKVNPDGTVKVLVFQRQTNNPANVTAYNSNTYGLGVFLKREFENFKDLFKKKDPDE